MKHYSVLLNETVKRLNVKKDGIYVDATLGLGGHTELLATLVPDGQIISLDQDPNAINHAKQRLAQFSNIIYVHDNFENIKAIVNRLGFERVDGIIYDLGTSYYQLTDEDRGFTYHGESRLDMRMNPEQSTTAIDVINDYSEEDLANIFYKYGDERKSRKLASEIVEERQQKRIETNTHLNEVIKRVKGWNKDKHPSKNIYQAIRIEVNREMDVLGSSLYSAAEILKVDSTLAVITFHSLEDIITKDVFHKLKSQETITPMAITKHFQTHKTIYPTKDEVEINKPSRSAKLRSITKKYEK